MTSANFGRQPKVSDTPKRGASNRARHDYDEGWCLQGHLLLNLLRLRARRKNELHLKECSCSYQPGSWLIQEVGRQGNGSRIS